MLKSAVTLALLLATSTLARVASAQTPAAPPPPPGAEGHVTIGEIQQGPQIAPAPPARAPAAYSPGYARGGYYYPGTESNPYAWELIRRRAVPYRGGPIPPGTRLEVQSHRSFIVTGLGIGLGMYAATALSTLLDCGTSAGGCVEWLFVPVVGPFVAAADARFSGDSLMQAFLVVDGLVQAGGLALALGGVLWRRTMVVDSGEGRFASGGRGMRWSLLPGAPGAPAGATLSVLRF